MKSGGEAALRWGTGGSLKRLYVCFRIASSQAVETAFSIVSFLPPCLPAIVAAFLIEASAFPLEAAEPTTPGAVLALSPQS